MEDVEKEDRKKLRTGPKDRSKTMLTVESLITWLQTQDPKACILAFEPNSNAYTEQFREIPNQYISTVKDAKVREREFLKSWFRGTDPKEKGFSSMEELVNAEMNEVFRYAQDSDVIINF